MITVEELGRVRQWAGRIAASRERNQAVAEVLEQSGDARERSWAKGLRLCGSGVWLRYHLNEAEEERQFVSEGYHPCDRRMVCVACAHRRAVRAMAAYRGRFAQLFRERGPLPVSFVTLTVRDSASLAEGYEVLMGGLRAGLMARKNESRGRNKSEWGAFVGGVFSVEFKRGSGSGEWHPHMHGLVCRSRRVDYGAFGREWEAMTCGSRQVAFVELGEGDGVFRSGVFGEVFKYAVKLGDLSVCDCVQVAREMAGRRLLRSFGVVWGQEADEERVRDDELRRCLWDWAVADGQRAVLLAPGGELAGVPWVDGWRWADAAGGPPVG